VGVIAGGVLQVVALWPSLKAIGYHRAPRIDVSHPAVREALRRMVPVLFGIGVYAIDVVIARHMLSTLGVGAQSYFGFALRLCDFPQGIFVMAIQAATLPSLAKLAAAKNERELTSTFAFGLRLSWFVGISATVLFVGLAEPIVALIFQRGAFTRADTVETARSMMAMGAGVWLVAGVRQLVAVYYAVGDTRTPVIVSAIDLVAFVGMALLLKDGYGHVGVAAAVTAASAVQVVLLFVGLRRHLSHLGTVSIVKSATKTLIAALVALGLARGLLQILVSCGFSLGIWLPGAIGSLVFGVGFLIMAALLRSDELSTIAGPLGRRFRRRH
jgi:putative peptidoglycan lipid II flippase